MNGMIYCNNISQQINDLSSMDTSLRNSSKRVQIEIRSDQKKSPSFWSF